MATELTGSFGKFAVLGGSRRIFEMPVEVVRQFFQDIALKKTDITLNSMGLYTFLNVGRHGKAKMTSLTVPKNLLQSRKNCKTWNPKGRMGLKIDEINTEPVEYMGEQCADAIYGTCLEYMAGAGNAVRDITATPEGQALFAQMLDNIFLGLGNSFYDLATYGQHPLIYDSATNSWWNQEAQTEEDWADFIDQQTGIAVKGHVTLMDEVQAEGYNHFNIQIKDSEVSGTKYVGDPIELFKRVEAGATLKMRTILRRRRQDMQVVYLVSPGIFDAYKDYILHTYDKIDESFRYFITRANGMIEPVDGVLRYDGKLVVSWDELAEFDELVGTTQHRIVATVTGNMLVAQEVENISQFDGLGLRVVQRLDAPYKGQTFMDTNFRLGTAIADTDFMAMGSHVVTP